MSIKLIIKTPNEIKKEEMDEQKAIDLELNRPKVVPLGEYYYSYEP